MQKIKNLLHHHHEAPVAPVAPMSSAPVASSHALTSAELVNGKETLHPVSRLPLDRNGDGRVDSLDLQGQNNTLNLGQGPATGFSSVRSEAPLVQVVEKEMVVHEHIHPVEKEEIQPVIHREREQLDIKQITQQLHETQIQPTLIKQRELAPEVRAPIVERAVIEENIVLPSIDRSATVRSTQVNAPILEEVVKKTVIEEIQPVLERDVFVPTVIQQTQPIYEKIVEAPSVYREVLPVRELGTRSVGTEFYERESPLMAAPAPVVPQQQFVTPVSVQTTTTTTDSFIPAKLVKENNLNNFTATRSPVERRVL